MATIIDDNFKTSSDTSVWPAAIRYGLIAGLINIALQVLGDLIGLSSFDPEAGAAATAYGYLGTIVTIVLMVMTVKAVRDAQGGRIGFGKAFGAAFATSLVALLIGGLWLYIYLSFIGTDVLTNMSEAALQEANFDEDAEGAETALGWMNAMFSPGAFALMAVFGGLILNAIISLIMAAIMKNE